MRWFHDLRLRAKLLVGFSAVVLLLLVVGATSAISLSRLASADEALYAEMTVPIAQAGEAITYVQRGRVNLRDAANAESPEAAAPFIERAGSFPVIADSILKEYQKTLTSDEGRRAYAAFADDFTKFRAAQDALIKAIQAGDRLGAFTIMAGDLKTAEDGLIVSAKAMVDQKVTRAEEVAAANKALQQRITIVMVVLVALGVALSLVIAFWVAGTLSRTIGLMVQRAQRLQSVCITNLSNALDALAAGRLDVRPEYGTPKLELTTKDELGELGREIDGIIARSVASIESYGRAADTLQSLVHDTQGLVSSARAGSLAARADADRYEGGYRELGAGINAMLDAIAAPINEAAAVLARVADRDLTAQMQGRYEGDFDRIREALNRAVANLGQALSEVSSAAAQVAGASEEISSGSQSLAEGAGEQASSLEEVSASIHEVSATARTSAERAQSARAVTDSAMTQANEGLQEVRQLERAVTEIKTSAHESAKIVKTIDEIAFQTNLLALNAAVEAARAGDAGRGFAVVAEEVRSLAMRAAEAARTTTDLINASVKAAEEGVSLNARVLKQFGAISHHVEAAREAMGEIAAGSEQQAVGLHQISTAVEQINLVTQRVAANAEEASATSVELSSQAMQLQELVHAFELEGDGRAAGRDGRGGAARASALEQAGAGAPRKALGRSRGAHEPAGR